MTRFGVAVALLLLSIGACAPERALPDRVVHWRGQELGEFDSLSALPISIRHDLRTDAPGLEGVADKGQPFNATDNIVGMAPMRRFITAGQTDDIWLVALEVGGLGYSVRVFQYSGGNVQKTWVLQNKPKNLEEMLQKISSLSPDFLRS